MSYVRCLGRSLVVAALLATVLALAASPAAAQNVFVFENIDARDKDGNDTTTPALQVWQMQVTVASLGGCTPKVGLGAEGYTSTWLRYDNQGGQSLDTATCSYSITAKARRSNQEVCDAEVGWGTSPSEYKDRLNTYDQARGTETYVSVRHKRTANDDPICAAAVTVTFEIDPAKVVKELPSHSTDDELEARVKRAVEITDFDVRVRPHSSTKDDPGCDFLLAFTMKGGEDNKVEKALEGIPIGAKCKFDVTIRNRPAPFVIDADGATFTAASTSETWELSPIVELRPARIAIIQDVVGPAGRGKGVSYTIERTCAGVDALPPASLPTSGTGIYRLPGGELRISLTEGRGTAHSDAMPNFGPGATYQMAARSLTSNTIEGCSVEVGIQNLPAGCTVPAGTSQRLTWRATAPFDHFDFEFDVNCGGSSGSTTIPSTDLPSLPDDAAAPTDPDVRIVARKLSNGKIEFGLQQQAGSSWSNPMLPTRRKFPTTAPLDRWLYSSPISLSIAASPEDFAETVEVRIVAKRRSSDRKVEFGLQERQDDGTWGERMLPARRLFPPDTPVGGWLRSSVLSLISATALGRG